MLDERAPDPGSPGRHRNSDIRNLRLVCTRIADGEPHDDASLLRNSRNPALSPSRISAVSGRNFPFFGKRPKAARTRSKSAPSSGSRRREISVSQEANRSIGSLPVSCTSNPVTRSGAGLHADSRA